MFPDLVALQVSDNRRNQRLTVLRRRDGQWHEEEVIRIVAGLNQLVSQHPKHPEYLIIMGEYSREAVLKAMLGGETFQYKVVVGMDNPDLPYSPGW